MAVTQRTGRVTCPKCGANNFDTVSACWKCSTPLMAGLPMTAMPSAGAYPVERQPQAYQAAAAGDPNAANRAAIWLALTIPWIGLPAGWIFMMVEDQRKQRVGRICVTWSLFALIFHILFTVMLVKVASDSLVKPLMQIATNMARGAGAGGGAGGGLDGATP